MLRRLMRWLEPFTPCFGHPAQPVSLRAYINGLLGDSPRKSIQAMLARVTAPPDYQAVNHFITRAPWSAEKMWQIVRAQLPERQGALILDDTGFPKKGDKSVGVARQYTGTLGKIGNCQVAVTAALWTGRLAWLVGALLYLPEEWANDPARRNEAHIPRTVTFRRKWELALQLVRQVRASGIELTGILGDSGYGDATALRRALHQMRLSYGFGVSATVTVFHGTPQLQAPRKVRGPRLRRPRYTLGETPPPVTVRDLAASLPATAWRSVTWQHADNPRRTAQCAAVRVTPANDWQHGHVLPDVWLLCERPDGTTDEKYYLINLPANTRLPRLVTFMHQRGQCGGLRLSSMRAPATNARDCQLRNHSGYRARRLCVPALRGPSQVRRLDGSAPRHAAAATLSCRSTRPGSARIHAAYARDQYTPAISSRSFARAPWRTASRYLEDYRHANSARVKTAPNHVDVTK